MTSSSSNDHHSSHHHKFINVRLDKSMIPGDKSHQIYFGCCAPLEESRINMHISENNESKIKLSYCCGIYLSIDGSFSVRSILSNEFISSVTKQAQMLGSNNKKGKMKEESKEKESKAKIVIYLPGYNYTFDKNKSCEYVLNESIKFGSKFSDERLVIPFMYPTEGRLIVNNNEGLKLVASQLSEFVDRLSIFYDQIDFIAHGIGNKVLLLGLLHLFEKYQNKEHNGLAVIRKSHIISIAPDITKSRYIKLCSALTDHLEKDNRITLYVNAFDWQMRLSQLTKLTESRAGHQVIQHPSIETIDTTKMVSKWFTLSSNHYYYNNEIIINDLKEILNNKSAMNNERTHLKRKKFKHSKRAKQKFYWKIKNRIVNPRQPNNNNASSSSSDASSSDENEKENVNVNVNNNEMNDNFEENKKLNENVNKNESENVIENVSEAIKHVKETVKEKIENYKNENENENSNENLKNSQNPKIGSENRNVNESVEATKN